VNGSFDGIIRTYNFPLNRVRDHRLGLSFGLAPVLDGGLDSIVEALLVRGSDIGES
jgi:protein subunit release factor A